MAFWSRQRPAGNARGYALGMDAEDGPGEGNWVYWLVAVKPKWEFRSKWHVSKEGENQCIQAILYAALRVLP